MQRSRLANRSRSAFTLIEMLVVVGIILTLASIAAVAVNMSLAGDRVPSGARQVQSYMEGARNRAIYSKEPRGVRFLLADPTEYSGGQVVTSMIYISAPELTPTATLRLVKNDNNAMTPPASPPEIPVADNGYVIQNLGIESPPGTFSVNKPSYFPSWEFMRDRGLMGPGSRIRIANGTTGLAAGYTWYTIAPDDFTPGADPERMKLVTQHILLGSDDTEYDLEYQIELVPSTLPGQTPTDLNEGVVIDLDESRLPALWKRADGSFIRRMDVMFTPRGDVTGPVAASGILHFLVCEQADVAARKLLTPADPKSAAEYDAEPGSLNKEGDDAIVSLFTRTGYISTSKVFNEDLDADNVANDADDPDLNENGRKDRAGDDPFYYAETGEAPLE